MEAILELKPHHDEAARRGHPWIFSGAVARLAGDCPLGGTVMVQAADGTPLGRAAYSPVSQIRARFWTHEPAESVDADFIERRLRRAIRARDGLLATAATDACRLVYAESDGLPGLVVDRYGSQLVVQALAAGAEFWKPAIVAALQTLTQPAGIYERSDADVRAKEGLALTTGTLAGEPPPTPLEIHEGPLRFAVDVTAGHKTGFYLDQRDSRRRVADLSRDAEVLNCFAYTGAFTVAAYHGGARHVTQVETSAPALALARRNLDLNGLPAAEDVADDVFHVLRRYRDSRRSFDLIILDPPKFAESRTQLPGACRGYKDINLLAFKLLRPGGTLVTFSCSGLLAPDLFQKIVADAALDAHREAQLIARLTQGADHPVALAFPEGAYLKGLVCRVW